jgi:hypothetical protein
MSWACEYESLYPREQQNSPTFHDDIAYAAAIQRDTLRAALGAMARASCSTCAEDSHIGMRWLCEHCVKGKPVERGESYGWYHYNAKGQCEGECDCGPIHDMLAAMDSDDAERRTAGGEEYDINTLRYAAHLACVDCADGESLLPYAFRHADGPCTAAAIYEAIEVIQKRDAEAKGGAE